jgi:Zn-dependent protease with chaperone function
VYTQLNGKKGAHKVTISDKAIETFTRDEFETIIAHEMSHIYNKDIKIFKVSLYLTSFFCIIIASLLLLFLNFFLNSLFLESVSLLLLIITLITVSLILKKIKKIIEIRSDIESAKMTNKVESYMSALNKMESTNSIYSMSRSNLEVTLSYMIDGEHPQTWKRIEYLKYINLDEIPTIDKRRPNLFKTIIKSLKCLKGYFVSVNHPPKDNNAESLDYAIYLFHRFKC